MQILEIIILAIGLSMDSFAVSIVCSSYQCFDIRKAFKLAFSLAFFQAALPLLGWLLGTVVLSLLQQSAHLIASFILIVVGLKMIVSTIKNKTENKRFNINNLVVLFGLSLATSVDAFIVGLSFKTLKFPVVQTVIIIFIITFLFSQLGVFLGKKYLNKKLGSKAEIVGGAFLIGIGIIELLEHLSLI